MSRTRKKFRLTTPEEFAALWLDPEVRADAIAARCGVSTCTVSRRAKQLGLGPRPALGHVPKLTRAQSKLLAIYWQAGCALDDIAAHFGICIGTVGETRKRLGLPGRGGGAQPKTTIAELQRAVEAMRMRDRMMEQAHAERLVWEADQRHQRSLLGVAA